MCEPLMPDVMVSKAHQNNRSCVSLADQPSESLRKNLTWWAVTRTTSKNHKTVKMGGGRLLGVWAIASDNTVLAIPLLVGVRMTALFITSCIMNCGIEVSQWGKWAMKVASHPPTSASLLTPGELVA